MLERFHRRYADALFVIIIISAILLLIFILMAIILFMRKRKSNLAPLSGGSSSHRIRRNSYSHQRERGLTYLCGRAMSPSALPRTSTITSSDRNRVWTRSVQPRSVEVSRLLISRSAPPTFSPRQPHLVSRQSYVTWYLCATTYVCVGVQ